jgi:ankyrin repeat protein
MRARHTAMRLLAQNPGIARASFFTSVVCGDAPEVARRLEDDPGLATRKSEQPDTPRSDAGGYGDLYRDLGSKGWEPLSYLCFTRLPTAAATENALTIARMLLDNGADPNCFFMAGDSRYTPLVGAIGEGEEERPAHPARDPLVDLLLARGADPYDSQVIYNIHFHGDVLWFLERSYEHSVTQGRKSDWADPEWHMLDMGDYGTGARWHLEIAIKHADIALAQWCLAHGANPESAPAKDKRFPQRSLYEEAVRRGRKEIADLLIEHGARRTTAVLSNLESFVASCMRGEAGPVSTAARANPELVESPEPLLAAAAESRADIAALLLDLGASPDAADWGGETPLHKAADRNALDVARVLIDRGAKIDPRERRFLATPLGFAVYWQHREMIDLLAQYSRDVWELTTSGKVDRLREVLGEHPDLAKSVHEQESPLMWLPPHDEAVAMEVARLLVANGADSTLRNRDGMTAADRAEMLAMPAVVEFLRRAARKP